METSTSRTTWTTNRHQSATPRPRSTSKSDKMVNYFFRRGGSPGYWSVFMLPLAIYLADIRFDDQSFPAVLIITYNAVVLSLIHSFTSDHFPVVLENIKYINIIGCLLTMVSCYFKQGVFYEYTSFAIINFSFPYIFNNFIEHYPFSFTFGEGMIITSGFVYNFWAASQNLVSSFPDFQDSPEPVLLTLIIQLAFFGLLLLARIILMIMKPFKFVVLEETYCLWAKGSFVAFTFNLTNTAEDIMFLIYWTIDFFFGSTSRLIFLVGWIACVIMGAWFLVMVNNQENPTTTVDRKFFHLLVCIVYLPAIFKDFNLIFLCSSIVMIGFLLIEALRVLRFTLFEINFGELIDSYVSRFRDSRDDGKLILTPIYLLAGCSIPIWLTGLHYRNYNNDLSAEEIAGALSGVLSIGIGDTFASVGGYYLGRTRWNGTSKTREGTLCSIIAQILFVILFYVIGALPFTTVSFIALIISSVINALVEAWTDQIDNLVLPLVTFNCIYGFKLLNDKLFQ